KSGEDTGAGLLQRACRLAINRIDPQDIPAKRTARGLGQSALSRGKTSLCNRSRGAGGQFGLNNWADRGGREALLTSGNVQRLTSADFCRDRIGCVLRGDDELGEGAAFGRGILRLVAVIAFGDLRFGRRGKVAQRFRPERGVTAD